MQLLSVKETAKRFNISERRVQKLCEAGRIDGAQMISNVWVIPDTAEKPTDERISLSVDNMVSLSELCRELSISIATGRNWIKLGKLIPSAEVRRTPFFTAEYTKKLKTDIETGNNTALKSRRNKKFVSGNHIYHSYVSENSVNVPIIQSVIDIITKKGIEITDDTILTLLADCAIQLITSKTGSPVEYNALSHYFNGKYKQNDYMFLVDDLLCQNTCTEMAKYNFPELFEIRYIYEDGEDILGLLYISLKNIGKRKATGSYYTPTNIVKSLCNRLFSTNSYIGKTVFDPCCGTGNFILQLPQEIDYSNVYGNDIDSKSVKLARINYALKYNVHDKNIIYGHITEQDYLNFPDTVKYDYIIGNPPWGYEFSEASKVFLRSKYLSAVGSNIESFDVFVEQAFHNLNNNGILSFVLPESFLNVQTHTPIRSVMMNSNSIQYLEYLGNVFDKVQCPCIIMQTIYNNRPFNTYGLIINDGKREYTIQTNRTVNAECMALSMTDEEYFLLGKIDSIENKVTLEGRAIFALGIVTGNNKDYVSAEKKLDNEMVLKGADIRKFRFNNADNYITFRPESFQQVAPVAYYRADEKLLYRFICNQLVFAYDNRQTLSLNSCNILIPQIDRINMKYIMAVLNSRPAQFYFKKQFNSVKVLRSHIEHIPIPYINEEEQAGIIELVDSILTASESEKIIMIYDSLDSEIAKLYKLSSDEYKLIKNSMDGENLFLL